MTSAEIPERALTFWQPWGRAITHHDKLIDNRPWAPWPSVLGKMIALHAGKKYSDEGRDWIKAHFGVVIPPSDCAQSAIIGIARVLRAAKQGDMFESEIVQDKWFMGPWGWRLDDVIAFDKPIENVNGAQGLWKLQGYHQNEIRERLRG